MTTAVSRPLTVTTRIGAPTTPTHPAAPAAPDVFTVTVYMNTHGDVFDGYEPHHPLAIASRPDGSPLRLVFRSSDRIRSHQDAAEAAFEVGSHQGADDNGQTWPRAMRPVSVGDVIKITGPGHWIIYLSVDDHGFSAVPEPATTRTHGTGRR